VQTVPEPASLAPEIYGAYSPASLLGIYANELRTPLDGKVIYARGVFQMRHNNKEYSGYFYDQLLSPNDNKSLRVRIHQRLRSTLHDNHIYTFKGFIEKKAAFSYIDLIFNVDEVVLKEEKKVSEEELARFDLLRKKSGAGYKNVEAVVKSHLFNNRHIRLANIYGHNAVVHEDFRKGVAGSIVNFDLSELRCNMSSGSEIRQLIQSIDNGTFDLIALVRGGGETASMNVFNDLALCEVLAACRTPIITALGHTVDDSLADRLADKKFALPHDYGNVLKQWSEEATEEASRSKSVFINQVKSDLEKTFSDQILTLKTQLENKNGELEKARIHFSELVEHLKKEKTETLLANEKISEVQIKSLAEQIRMKEETVRQLQAAYDSTRENITVEMRHLQLQLQNFSLERDKLKQKYRGLLVVLIIFVLVVIAGLVFGP
jgi:exodeoxyribonuclease VII large subunit